MGQAFLAAHIVEQPGQGGTPPDYIVVPGEPIQTQIMVFSEGGALVAEITTAADGKFTLPLKPGTYSLVPSPFNLSSNLFVPVISTITVSKKEWAAALVIYAYSPD
jgi:hypothetical protein